MIPSEPFSTPHPAGADSGRGRRRAAGHRGPPLSSHPPHRYGPVGALGGFAYFCAVYYSGNSGNRSRNVGINECLVGLGSFSGLILEYFMKRSGIRPPCTRSAPAPLGISVILQCAVAWVGTGRFRSRPTARPAET